MGKARFGPMVRKSPLSLRAAEIDQVLGSPPSRRELAVALDQLRADVNGALAGADDKLGALLDEKFAKAWLRVLTLERALLQAGVLTSAQLAEAELDVLDELKSRLNQLTAEKRAAADTAGTPETTAIDGDTGG